MLRLFLVAVILIGIGVYKTSASLHTLGKAVSAAPEQTAQTKPVRQAAQTKMVYMYSATWCGVCKAASADLRKAGIRFTEFFIDRDEGRQRELGMRLQKAGVPPGPVGVPIFVIGDQMLRGYSSVGDIQKAAL